MEKRTNGFSPYSPEFWREFSRKRGKRSAARRALAPHCWDKAASTYDDLEQCPDYMKQVNTVMERLITRGILNRDTRVLDVGCGTGVYAIRMARYVKEVVALDVSRAMLAVLKEKLQDLSISNVNVVQADWREYHVEEGFDLVFASMTPLFRSLSSVDKLLAASTRHVAFVSWAGVKENQLLERLFQEILGENPQKGDERPDMLILFNYLYSLGYASDLTFFHGCWKRRRSKERQLESVLWQLELYRELTPEERGRARTVIEQMGPGDEIDVTTKVRTCLLLIDKTLRDHRC